MPKCEASWHTACLPVPCSLLPLSLPNRFLLSTTLASFPGPDPSVPLQRGVGQPLAVRPLAVPAVQGLRRPQTISVAVALHPSTLDASKVGCREADTTIWGRLKRYWSTIHSWVGIAESVHSVPPQTMQMCV